MTQLARKAADLLGEPVLREEPIHGGDLSQVCRLHLGGGREVIAKGGPAPAVEAAMLAALARAGAMVPAVIACDAEVLVLEALADRGALGAAGWAELGGMLRRVHAASGPAYGWNTDHAFGAVAIPNAWHDHWPQFWAERRLLAEAARLPAPVAARLGRLAARLPELLPARPRPGLLHGDLWVGNILADGGRLSGVIDPACYYGHAEVDLAMLTLFGRPPEAFRAAYGRPAAGWELRRAVYQLWPAIVHLRLFGAGYRGLVEGLLARAGV